MTTARQRVALGVALLAVLAYRLVQVRSLELPAWVDSVHHALLVRILLERGSLPADWGPYLPDVPFYYHFGFHVSAEVLARLTGWTGLDLGGAVVVAGELWQVAVAAVVALLSLRLTRSPAKALTALLLVAFVSPMPGYYVSWGRYTLLAGLALLAFGMASALGRGRVALAALVAATAVTHYFAFVLLLAFLGAVI